MLLHEKLRSYRQATGVTQTHVAKTMGISIKKLNAIEVGRQKLSADMFADICRRGLGVSPAIFFKNDVLETKTKHPEAKQSA